MALSGRFGWSRVVNCGGGATVVSHAEPHDLLGGFALVLTFHHQLLHLRLGQPYLEPHSALLGWSSSSRLRLLPGQLRRHASRLHNREVLEAVLGAHLNPGADTPSGLSLSRELGQLHQEIEPLRAQRLLRLQRLGSDPVMLDRLGFQQNVAGMIL
nr:hypothetical protein Iba_chr12aCG7950 [Ipomoea batatas]